MCTAVSMCILRASLTSFMCIHDIYLAHICNRCAGGSDTSGVQGSEPGGGARGSGNRRSSHRGGVARVPWPPPILFPERQAPEHSKSPMFLQISWVSFIVDDTLSIGIGWNKLLHYILTCPDKILWILIKCSIEWCLAMLRPIEVRWFPITYEI